MPLLTAAVAMVTAIQIPLKQYHQQQPLHQYLDLEKTLPLFFK